MPTWRGRTALVAVGLVVLTWAGADATDSRETQSPNGSVREVSRQAQNGNDDQAPGSTNIPTPVTVLESQEFAGILGQGVLSKTGEKMGQIVDMIVDHNGQIRAVVIDFGGFLGVGSRKIAVDWNAVHFVTNGKSFRVVLDLTRDEVTGSPEYKTGEKIVILRSPPASEPSATPPAK